VIDIQNDSEMRKVAAMLPEMVTRASQSVVRENAGFYDVFPISNKDNTSLNLTQVKKDTAILLGKNSNDAKVFFEKGIANIIPDQISEINISRSLQEGHALPSFGKDAEHQRAIVKWMLKRYPSVSERKVRHTLQMMVSDGILRREKGNRNKIVYS